MRGFETPPASSPTEVTPQSNGRPLLPNDDIPIDPALSGQSLASSPVADPTHIEESLILIQASIEEKAFLPHRIQYTKGPQGDPFAPPELPVLLPVEAPQSLQLKPAKKKRKTPWESACSICRSEEHIGTDGPEPLLSCVDCKLKGHPSCFDLTNPAEAAQSKNWQCFACKICESCLKKDGDNRLLLCDSCDRGWHMDCLDPPLEAAPPGDWFCPRCEPPAEGMPQAAEYDQSNVIASRAVPPARLREPSIASSSRSGPNDVSKIKRKGKNRAIVSDESEGEMDIGSTPGTSRTSTRRKSRHRRHSPVGDKSLTEPTSSPTQTISLRRPRIRLSSPKPPVTGLRLKLPARGKGKEREDEPDESKGMFDEFLAPEDRDVGATSVNGIDKARFEASRVVAEDKLMPPPPLPLSTAVEESVSISRPLRSMNHHQSTPLMTPGPSTSPAPSTAAPNSTNSAGGQRIRSIRFGQFDVQTWYDAPFPEEYMSLPDGKLWICEFCLKYMKSEFNASRHRLKCKMRHPPGDEIYRDGSVAIFEVDGRKNKIYCQNLCLLSKMFLDHKSLFYDVEPFLFYVITDIDDTGARFVGYFSKEKRCPKDYNLSCIMTLPVRQRQGWGMLLIDFSYLLSKKEQRAGTPEKPLSALGAIGYKSYWTLTLMRYLRTAPHNPRLEDISKATSMTLEDVYHTLLQQDMIHIRENAASPRPLPGQSIKSIKGRKSGVARKALHRNNTRDDDSVKGPFVPPKSYKISWDPEVVVRYLERWNSKGNLSLKPENLKWSPFLVARTLKSEGLLEDGLLPGTDSATPTTPGFGSRSSATGDSRTYSPTFPLFDDDDHGGSASDILPVLSSRDKRQHSPASSVVLQPPPVSEETPRRLTRRQTSGNLSVTPRQPTNLRRTRSAMKVPNLPHDEAMIAEDAALAARLAMEEDRPRRLLRSRSNTEQEKRPLSPQASSASVSPRKRRRVETDSPPARNTRSQGPLPTPRRPDVRRRSSVRTPARKPKAPWRTSRVVHEDVDTSPLSRSSPPPETPSPMSSRPNDEDEDGEEGEDPVKTQLKTGEPESQPEPERDKELKDEDRDTPLTGLTSRHSVGHSDDTVCAVEDQAGSAHTKVPPPFAVSVVVPLNAGRTDMTADVIAPKTSLSGIDDPDADAEGEEDLDAEGDADVDGDVDAEGEEDLDAEGEPYEEEEDEILIDEPVQSPLAAV